MVAVLVRDVVVDQRVRRSGIRLDPAVLVVVREVPGDRVVSRLVDANAGRGTRVPARVGKRVVVQHLRTRGRADHGDAGIGVVVDRVPGDRYVGRAVDADAVLGLTAHRLP